MEATDTTTTPANGAITGKPSPEPAQKRPDKPGPSLDGKGASDSSNPHMDKEPDAAERSVPRIARDLGSAYHFDSVTGNGPSAYGDGATAVSVTLATLPEGAKFWLEEVDAVRLGAAADTYVATGIEERLDATLRSEGLVYLSGESGTGRFTAALAALRRVGSGARIAELHRVPGSTMMDLAQQGDLRTPSVCWVVRWETVPDRILLAGIAGTMRRSGSILVMLGQSDDQNRELSRFLVDHQRADTAEVFVTHLRSELLATPTCLDACPEAGTCAGACIESLVEGCRADRQVADGLSELRQPYLVVSVARAVAARRPQSCDDIIDAMHASMPTMRPLAATLLRGTSRPNQEPPSADPVRGPDPALTYRRSFRIAYALLSNCPIGLVAEAAKQLLELMLPTEPDAEDDEAPRRTWDEFGFVFDDLVPSEMRSDVMPPDAVPTGDGGRLAWLADRRLMGSLLDVAWNDYPHGQERLMEWLWGLGRHGSGLVRQRAAIAAGFICYFDFDRVYYGVLVRWATSYSYQMRQAAGIAMAYAATNGRVASRAQERVRKWAQGDARGSAPLLRDAAIRAHSAGLAKLLPVHHVLDDVEQIGKGESHQESRMISRVIEEISSLSTMNVVVTTLHRWQDTDALLGIHAARSMTRLVRCETDVDGHPWPLLLRWAMENPDARAELEPTLGRTLLQPETAFEAWRNLGGWLSAVGESQELGDALIAMLAELFDRVELRNRARFYLDRVWRPVMPLNPLLDRIAELVAEQR